MGEYTYLLHKVLGGSDRFPMNLVMCFNEICLQLNIFGLHLKMIPYYLLWVDRILWCWYNSKLTRNDFNAATIDVKLLMRNSSFDLAALVENLSKGTIVFFVRKSQNFGGFFCHLYLCMTPKWDVIQNFNYEKAYLM